MFGQFIKKLAKIHLIHSLSMIILLAFYPDVLNAVGLKKVKISNINASAFPEIAATLSVQDSANIPIPGLLEDNFTLKEDYVLEQLSIESIFEEGALVDIAFVFDTTVSMQPFIDALKIRTKDFTDSLEAKSIDYSLGLITFGDDCRVFNNGNFTTHVDSFQSWIDVIVAFGGGSRPENPYDALEAASNMSFREGSQKIFILITDAPAHYRGDPDSSDGHWKRTLPEVIDLLKAKQITCHVVGPNLTVYNGSGSLSQETGGKYFNINSNFTYILNYITTILSGQYTLTYTTHNMWADGTFRHLRIETSYLDKSAADTSFYYAPDKTVALHFSSDQSSYQAGDTISLDINIGTTDVPARDLFGLSFAVNFDTTYLYYIDNFPAAFFGADTLAHVWSEPDSGKIFISITKMGADGAAGYGTVRNLLFGVRAEISDTTTGKFDFSSIVAFDQLWVRIPIIPENLTINLVPEPTQLLVWPGDTDNNGIVNQADVLPIGIFWELNGPVRPYASLTWSEQSCPSWSSDQRATYVDATGDGTINMNDIIPIGLNWGKKHTVGKYILPPSVTKSKAGKIASHFQFDPLKTSCELEIKVKNVKKLSGVSFELHYPSQVAEIISVEQDIFFNNNALFYYKNDQQKGILGVAICQKETLPDNKKAGTIAKINFKYNTKLSNDYVNQFKINNVITIDNMGSFCSLFIDEFDVEQNVKNLPLEFRLEQNYPNPFNPTTCISYHVPFVSQVNLKIINITGKLVKILQSNYMEPGSYKVFWDGKDQRGVDAAAGLYFIKMTTENFYQTKKCLLIR